VMLFLFRLAAAAAVCVCVFAIFIGVIEDEVSFPFRHKYLILNVWA